MCPDPTTSAHSSVPANSPDTLFDGKLICAQSQDGYRFSIDAVLLAHFVTPRRRDRVLDLGAGCGVVSLIMACRHPEIFLTCLELQDSLVALIRNNIRDNHLDHRIRLVAGDLCAINGLVAAGEFDLVVCNPPYYRNNAGRRNPGREQAIARHEIKAGQEDILQAASFALRTKGRLAMIYPATRLAALLAAMKGCKLEPKRLRVVHSYPGSDATLCLVEAVKCGGEGLGLQSPLYIYERPDGDYSSEVAAWYRWGEAG